jgi:predicted Zn-dependent peptidase
LLLSIGPGILTTAKGQDLHIPLATHTLKNGLRIVVSEDHSSPIFGSCIAYGVGFRREIKGRAGFAHLFEHMMFEGTPDVPKGVMSEVVEGAGGQISADTRSDRTQFVEGAPTSALNSVLWLEADRMKALAISEQSFQNERNVVKEEIRSSVLNQPYGIFYVLDLPQQAFDTFPNNHNFYGDFHDLDSASLAEVRDFYTEYYAPNNAVIAIVGDVNAEEVFRKADKYFGQIPRRDIPARTDATETPQERERQSTEYDPLIKLPAFAVGYRMPPHGSHDSIVAAVAGNLLHDGEASLLYQQLVKEKKVAVTVNGGLNWPLGNPYEYNGPTLMTSFIVSPMGTSMATVLSAYDRAIAQLTSGNTTSAELQRVVNKMRSDLMDQLEPPLERASFLAEATLYDETPDSVNAIPRELEQLTPLDIQKFAQKFLVPENRSVIARLPAPAPAPSPGNAQKKAAHE